VAEFIGYMDGVDIRSVADDVMVQIRYISQDVKPNTLFIEITLPFNAMYLQVIHGRSVRRVKWKMLESDADTVADQDGRQL